MGTSTIPPPSPSDKLLEAILRQLEALNARFDEFAEILLAGKLPFGRPIDRWSSSARWTRRPRG